MIATMRIIAHQRPLWRICPRTFLLFHLLLLTFCLVCVTSWVVSPQQLFQFPTRSCFPGNTHLSASTRPWQSLASPHKDPFNAVKQLWYDVELPETNDAANHLNEPAVLAFLFVSQEHAADFEALAAHAQLQFSASGTRIQCVAVLGSSVIGQGREWEDSPGISLLIGGLPRGITAHMDTITSSALSDSDASSSSSSSTTSSKQQSTTTVSTNTDACLVFADPWAPLETILHNEEPSNVIVAGGISCPTTEAASSLALNGKTLPQGSALTVQFVSTVDNTDNEDHNDTNINDDNNNQKPAATQRITRRRIACQTVVSQGCRPASSVMQVTDCDGKVILELDGQPALKVLQQVVDQASSEQERALIQSQLLCGLAKQASSTTSSPPDDFVCRQIMGFVSSVQGIAIGTNERIDVGDWFCFQVRDANVAQKDLDLMVQRAQMARLFETSHETTSSSTNQPFFALQISCVARGSRMFQGSSNVDLGALQKLVTMQKQQTSDDTQRNNNNDQQLTDDDDPSRSSNKALLPIAGFFANGEIGPLGLAGYSRNTPPGRPYLHSFTNVAIILSEVVECDEDQGDGQVISTKSSSSSTIDADGGFLDAWG